MNPIDDNTILVDEPVFPSFLNHRVPDSHKGTFGHALLIAGSYGKMGAAVLAARACLRSGVGLLTVHVPRHGVDVMQVAVPEAMVSIDDDDTHFTRLFTAADLQRYDAVAVGPGLGTNSQLPLRSLLEASQLKPLVLDADALNMLSQMEDRLQLLRQHSLRAATVLTPHAKEFERLFGPFDSPEQRLQAQRQLSADTGAVIVYKGHRTQTTGRGGELYVNTTGNPGMATAGSGDVLTGILLAIFAQNKQNQIDAEMCATLGVWLHGKSGDFALLNQSQCSLVAGDIVKNLMYVTR
ncbi:MAG: NAD(P)H-hydrate dehydratase [Bacteroidales bacterium]|nr:NAD(P)H-hydrate dehydratase [Bacteroidales bacterium]